jgi:hypothetical protein
LPRISTRPGANAQYIKSGNFYKVPHAGAIRRMGCPPTIFG